MRNGFLDNYRQDETCCLRMIKMKRCFIMKKIIAMIGIFLLCVGMCSCANAGSNAETETTQPAEPKEKVWVCTKIESINQEGDVISLFERRYNDDGELIFWGTNLKGQLSFGVETTYEYKFDEQNNLTEMRAVEADGGWEVYTFNSLGYITQTVSYYSDGDLADRQEYEYDEAGRIILNINYYDNGKIDDKRLYEYRPDGTCEKITCYEADDVLLYITDCDENGMPQFTQYYNAKAPTYTYAYQYDSYGNLIERVQYFGTSTREQSRDRYTYEQIAVTALQKMILEAKDRCSPN